MDKNKLNVISPFGPSIAKVKIPDKIIKLLNNHVDKIRNNEKLFEKFDAGKTLIGNVKQEIFLSKELELRRKNNLPPFERFISLIITGKNEQVLERDSIKFKNFIENQIKGKVLGPVNAPIYRINQKFRNRLLIRAKKTSSVQKKLKDVLNDFQLSKGMKLSVDVDPISFN